jgi:hypothetical protein
LCEPDYSLKWCRGIPGFLFPSSAHLPQDHRFGMDRKKSGKNLNNSSSS